MNHSLFEEYNKDPARICAEITQYLESRQYESYGDIAGLCNPVLSKNPFTSNFLSYYLSNETTNISVLSILQTCLGFIFHNSRTVLYESLLILLTKKTKLSIESKPIIISFFNYSRKNESFFDDLYLTGLQKELISKNKDFIYLPKLYNFPKNPISALKSFKELKSQNSALIIPYELIPRWQFFKLLSFSFIYFIKTIKTVKLFSSNKMDLFYNKALLESLKYSEASKYIYYLAAKNISIEGNSKIVLWYENQSIDKCLIKGIRENNSEIEILACQFFLLTSREMNLFPSKFEIEHNLLPDSIFIMQMPPSDSLIFNRYRIGKGLRYSYLQQHDILQVPLQVNGFYSVFLTIFRDKNGIAFDLLKNSFLKDKKLYFKKHPALSNDSIPSNVNWEITNEFQEDLLLKSDLVFVTDTGLTYEALAMARQVIILGAENKVTQFVPPVEYQNKLWIYVSSVEQLEESIQILKQFKEQHPDELRLLAQQAKDTFFQNSNLSITELLGFPNE